MQLEFKINEQTLTHENPEKNVVAKSVKYLTCYFTFSEDWDCITKTAVFVSAKGDVFNVILKDDICLVPYEVIEYPHFTVSVFGGDRITANKVTVNVAKSGYIKGETPKEPTPDVYNQILNSVKSPYIGDNGNWFIWDNESNCFIDSGQKSQGDIPVKEIETYIDGQTQILKNDIEGLQKQINEEAHFRGYLSTNAKIQALEATPNDFAYSAESGTKWVYDEIDGWKDTGVAVPDQLTPASDATPLINGDATAGKSEEYARGDHRHPTDTTRASALEFNQLKDRFDKSVYTYSTVNMADILAILSLSPNTVTYAYGVFDIDDSKELHLTLVDGEIENGTPEETVLILDFSAMEIIPSIIFSADGIKWLNGEPPTVEAGKMYMFSFFRSKINEQSCFYLGIGGEFA